MGKTIIQTIGPLYGEPVNGTVFGRPNGSIFVPPTNTITATLAELYRYVTVASATQCRLCNSAGASRTGAAYNLVCIAQAQDLASNIQLQIYSNPECTAMVAYRNWNAGDFNDWGQRFYLVEGATIEAETTYYVRAQLLNNGSPVATSDVIEITGVVTE